MASGKKLKLKRPVRLPNEVTKSSGTGSLFNKWVHEVIRLWKEGYSNDYIKEYIIANKEGKLNVNRIHDIFDYANKFVVNEHYTSSEDTQAIHIRRYNDEINRLFKIKEYPKEQIGKEISFEKWLASRNRQIHAWNCIIDTMIQKEKVLGYHKAGINIVINNNETVEIKDKKPKIDISKLSLQEQVEMYYLMKKARKDENELAGITEGKPKEKKVIEDIESEVVEDRNVDKIKHEEKGIAVPVGTPTKIDPTIKLKDTLKRLALRRFKEAGGKLTAEEEKLLEQDKIKV